MTLGIAEICRFGTRRSDDAVVIMSRNAAIRREGFDFRVGPKATVPMTVRQCLLSGTKQASFAEKPTSRVLLWRNFELRPNPPATLIPASIPGNILSL
jgi:hypothetical protein